MLGRICAAAVACLAVVGLSQGAAAEDEALTLHHMHTGETATIVFKRDGVYDQDGLRRLNVFLRDWRKNQPTKMDPKLFDLIYEVYQELGATQPIQVVCGYRSPDTNAMLRRRSSGVAQNSLHMRGQAMDFYIPGVPLAKLRAIGMRMQAGGVGFYPTSGSPFVHMDTGSVRHWPRMTRQQLVAVFPEGHTLHIPSDGKPLPGYAEALAAYKARQAKGIIAPPDGPLPSIGGDNVLVAASDDVPLPRLSPDHNADQTDQVGMIVALNDGADNSDSYPLLSYPPKVDRVIGPDRFASFDPSGEDASVEAEVDFDTAYSEQIPVPAELAHAMAARDRTEHSSSASLPIAPTAVVSTVDIGVDLSRSLRADAITAAVFRDTQNGEPPPRVLAYASATAVPTFDRKEGARNAATDGVPMPPLNPLRDEAASPAPPPPPARTFTVNEVYSRLPASPLTLTKLDTQGLRLWIAGQSTREKRYALFTMPDFSGMPVLLDKPEVTFAARFDRVIYRGMRTDHFAGSPTQPPAVVDLTTHEIIAAR